MINELSRRTFLLRAGTGISAAWISANWPRCFLPQNTRMTQLWRLNAEISVLHA